MSEKAKIIRKARYHVKKITLQIFRYLKKLSSPKKNPKFYSIFKWLGKTVFDKKLWRIDKNKIAVGAGMGIFIALLPITGFQIIVLIALACKFRFNVPISTACTFISNVFTLPFIIIIQNKIGSVILHTLNFIIPKQYIQNKYFDYLDSDKAKMISEIALSFSLGVLFTSFFFGIFTYVLINIAWEPFFNFYRKHHVIENIEKLPRIIVKSAKKNTIKTIDRAKAKVSKKKKI